MKRLLFVLAMAGLVHQANAATELPAEIDAQLVVEAAWVRPAPAEDTFEIFLVINNRSSSSQEVVSVGWPDAQTGVFLSPSGRVLDSFTIPMHSELYMTADGVRVAVDDAPSLSSTTPVEIELSSGKTLTVPAAVLAPGERMADHHEYDHQGLR